MLSTATMASTDVIKVRRLDHRAACAARARVLVCPPPSRQRNAFIKPGATLCHNGVVSGFLLLAADTPNLSPCRNTHRGPHTRAQDGYLTKQGGVRKNWSVARAHHTQTCAIVIRRDPVRLAAAAAAAACGCGCFGLQGPVTITVRARSTARPGQSMPPGASSAPHV